jgi:hypothetical protein
MQMLDGLGPGGPSAGSGQRLSSAQGGSGAADQDGLAALAELPPDQAALWRQRIL